MNASRNAVVSGSLAYLVMISVALISADMFFGPEVLEFCFAAVPAGCIGLWLASIGQPKYKHHDEAVYKPCVSGETFPVAMRTAAFEVVAGGFLGTIAAIASLLLWWFLNGIWLPFVIGMAFWTLVYFGIWAFAFAAERQRM